MNKKYLLPALLSLSIFFMLSCNEDPSFLGRNILPSNENVYINVDSSTIINGYTVGLDYVKISNKSLSLLGSYEDEVFGKSTANFLTQLIFLHQNEYDPEASYTIDSITLSFRYDNFIGSLENLQNFSIYELTQELDRDENYYTTFNVNDYYDPNANLMESYYLSAEALEKDTVVLDALGNLDTIQIIYDSLYSINFTLSQQVAEKILDADSATLSHPDNFNEYFKGLYVTSSNTSASGCILYTELLSDYSILSIKLSNSDTAFNLIFYPDINTARVNIFNHEYESYPIAETLNDTVNEENTIYIQSMAGASGLLKLNIDNWLDSMPVVINKAELIIKPDFSTYPHEERFPKSLRLFTLKEGYEMFSPDYFGYLSDGDQSALYDEDKNQYAFNLTLHIQDILKEEIENRPLILIAGNNTISANRVVIQNETNSESIKLKIYYTKL